MKILLAGNWQWIQYEKAFSDAMKALGHDVTAFVFSDFFSGKLGRYQNALAALPGPAAINLNKSLLGHALKSKPDILFVWRGIHIWPSTLKKIRKMGCLLVSYNNDDPFGPHVHQKAPWHHHFLWTWYIKSLKEYDINFVYRSTNVSEAIAVGARNVHVLMPYYIPHFHHPVELNIVDQERYGCDIVFVGHYEPDGREQYLRAIIEQGLHVRLFGGEYWTTEVLGDLSAYLGQVRPVYEMEYANALCGAKICLAFLSKMNRDTYTRRCFEIPACGRLLLCERTDDLKIIFKEDEEAVFFSNKKELVEKSLWLLDHPEIIESIATSGRKRVLADGHDVDNRVKKMLDLISRHISPVTEKM